MHPSLAYRCFCCLDRNDRFPDHSTFSKNRHGRFLERELLRHLFEMTVARCIEEGLVSDHGRGRVLEPVLGAGRYELWQGMPYLLAIALLLVCAALHLRAVPPDEPGKALA